MLLRNLMEDKQLNLDQPLLSVRRHSPTVPSQKRDNRRIDTYSHQLTIKPPTYISELKSGPIRDPGAVPFVWEHSPGQPKENTKPQSKNSAVAPKLPPGRPNVCNKQGVNGSCTSESKKQDGDIFREFRTFLSEDRVKEEEGSDSGDEAYIDALDTLSTPESSFLNCRASGLSGLGDVDLKSSQACEFVMMDRFLPAAEAVASETPEKQPVQVQTQQVKNTSEKNKPSLRYGPSFAKKYAYYNNEEDEIDEEDEQEAYLPSVCGLLPRFCLKSSLCLISPVNGTSVRTQVEPPYGNKTRSRSLSSCSYNEVDKMQIDKANLRSESDATLPFLEHEENRHTGIEDFRPNNGLKTFGEFLEDGLSPDGSDSEDTVLEKTLYAEGVSVLLEEEEEDAAKARKEEDFKKFHNAIKFGDNLLVTAEEAATQDNSKQNQFSLLAPPPLPNSPSDSWLCRTLPSMTAKSSPLRPFQAPESEKKWETIVKATKVQRRHSEESLTTIPET